MSTFQVKVGDHVEYEAVGGGTGTTTSFTTGVVVDIITEAQPAGSQGTTVHATEDEPRVLIKNDNTQKETAYKTVNIKRVID